MPGIQEVEALDIVLIMGVITAEVVFSIAKSCGNCGNHKTEITCKMVQMPTKPKTTGASCWTKLLAEHQRDDSDMHDAGTVCKEAFLVVGSSVHEDESLEPLVASLQDDNDEDRTSTGGSRSCGWEGFIVLDALCCQNSRIGRSAFERLLIILLVSHPSYTS